MSVPLHIVLIVVVWCVALVAMKRKRAENDRTPRKRIRLVLLDQIDAQAARIAELEKLKRDDGLALRNRFAQDDALWEPPTPADLGPRAAGSPDEPSA